MPLSLEEYVEKLDGRTDLPWPAAPKVDPPKAKPHLEPLPVRGVLWTVYGTLVAVPGGELAWEAKHDFVTDAAVDKTIKEFKMWQSMSRKPGKPSEYMRELMNKALTQLKMAGSGGEKHPEVRAELIWDDIVKKLQQKEYQYDAGTYGPPAEYVKKIAYFYHASIQGAGAYPGAAEVTRMLWGGGKPQGLLADGQSFTPGQLQRCFRKQDPDFDAAAVFPPPLRLISAEFKARKPSDTLFQAAVRAMAAKGLRPSQVLHVGSSLDRDIAPAKKHGFRTALFAGDKGSLAATPDGLKDPATRPDVLLTELTQVLDVFG
ncbi:MAG: HAD hydrolase-like protein [Gemmataceae bacterium]|nr:HAD hydrolase-like protein [Gemmataceae bacterium]